MNYRYLLGRDTFTDVGGDECIDVIIRGYFFCDTVEIFILPLWV